MLYGQDLNLKRLWCTVKVCERWMFLYHVHDKIMLNRTIYGNIMESKNYYYEMWYCAEGSNLCLRIPEIYCQYVGVLWVTVHMYVRVCLMLNCQIKKCYRFIVPLRRSAWQNVTLVLIKTDLVPLLYDTRQSRSNHILYKVNVLVTFEYELVMAYDIFPNDRPHQHCMECG